MAEAGNERAREAYAAYAKDPRDRKKLQAWLETQPREVSIAIAARAALRVTPLLRNFRSRKGADDFTALILPLLRGTAAPWAAAVGPALSAEVLRAAAAAAAADAAAAAAADAAAARAADAAAADAAFIHNGGRPADLAARPLWPSEPPGWAIENWKLFKAQLHAANEDWQVWTDWYEGVLYGKPFWNLPAERGLAIMVEALSWDESEWKKGPAHINARMRQRIEEEQNPPVEATIPPQAPAAIEPEWIDGKLTLPARPAAGGLDRQGLEAALSALRKTLLALAEDADAEAKSNAVDRRIPARIKRVADQIPASVPPQDELFRLAHEHAALSALGAAAAREWPDVLAADFTAMLIQFDGTVRQFPRWREFTRNRETDTLTRADAAAIPAISEAAEKQLAEASDVIAPELPSRLAALRAMLPSPDEARALDEALTRDGEDLLIDIAESLNNIMKRLAENVLVKDYAKAFGKEARADAARAGKSHAKLLRPSAEALLLFAVFGIVTGSAGAAAGVAALPFLARFKWAKPLIDMIKRQMGN